MLAPNVLFRIRITRPVDEGRLGLELLNHRPDEQSDILQPAAIVRREQVAQRLFLADLLGWFWASRVKA
jgi:hypothetical protein